MTNTSYLSQENQILLKDVISMKLTEITYNYDENRQFRSYLQHDWREKKSLKAGNLK